MFYSNQRKDMGSYVGLEGKTVVSSRKGGYDQSSGSIYECFQASNGSL